MINFRHFRSCLFLLALAMVGAGEKLRAQENVSGPNGLPVIMDHKQAVRLVLAQPTPEYPTVAKMNYLQGHVHLELTVDGRGKVANAHVLEGNAILAASAVKAARRWTYHPLATAAGPSGFITMVEVRFVLDFRKAVLTPQQALRDFVRQIKPPQVVRTGEDAPSEDVVHMRLLVNDQGEVDDLEISPMGRARFEAAREILRGWTFRPAHWGTLPIASYLDVDVPVGAPSVVRTAANSGSR